MSHAVFPDNTVLCNFAYAHRLPLLEQILRGRGRWVEAVAAEADLSSHYLPDLTHLRQAGWLGEPIDIDGPGTDEVNRIRRAVFGGTEQHPLQHLGEAQSIYVMTRTPGFADAWWVTDDREAARYGQGQGLTVKSTPELLEDGVAMGELTSVEAHSIWQHMRTRGTRPRPVRSGASTPPLHTQHPGRSIAQLPGPKPGPGPSIDLTTLPDTERH